MAASSPGAEALGVGAVVDRGRRSADQPGRWSMGERSVLLGLRDADLRDVYRDLHGYGREGFSWVMKRKAKRWYQRYDHVFASASLGATRCEYLHRVRGRVE